MVNQQRRSESSSPATPERRLSAADPRSSVAGSSFHGVRMRASGRWGSEIRIPNSRDKIWLGSFSTREQAARAYDAASILLRRPFPLNFPDSASLLLLPQFDLTSSASLPSRHFIKVTAQRAALSTSDASTNSLPAPRIAASTCGTGIVHPHCSITESTASGGSNSNCASRSLQEDQTWIMPELYPLILPEEAETIQIAPATSTIDGAVSLSALEVLGAASIPLKVNDASALRSGAGGDNAEGQMRVQEQLSWEEYDEALLEMLARDGFTASSKVVTTTQRIDTETNS